MFNTRRIIKQRRVIDATTLARTDVTQCVRTAHPHPNTLIWGSSRFSPRLLHVPKVIHKVKGYFTTLFGGTRWVVLLGPITPIVVCQYLAGFEVCYAGEFFSEDVIGILLCNS